MQKLAVILAFVFGSVASIARQQQYPVYEGKDLGLIYSSSASVFRIWAPLATEAELRLYQSGEGNDLLSTYPLQKGKDGTWLLSLPGNRAGLYYTFRVKNGNTWSLETPDPYAKAVGVNGKRAMIINLEATNPPGWKNDHGQPLVHPTDAVIYELNIRDATMAASSGVQHRGKYAGLTERGTVNKAGLSTGLDHLAEMGVTHVHLLPFFDFNSIDESIPGNTAYNWGYDPLNYNAPEGSFASDARDGAVRIRELKAMIAAFHQRKLNVVMDVVYNHTSSVAGSSFNQLVPDYYYRHTADGKLSDATACGNETASEQPMMRKFMIESMLYWMKEYHIDGFRMDLMGVHDMKTIQEISTALHGVNPNVLLYGEGWTAGSSPLPDSLRALKKNVAALQGVAVFNDDLRDGIKGSVFDAHDRGFASGKQGMEESIKFGLAAACPHPQVNYNLVNYSHAPYAMDPSQVINYVSCHDNNTLWDKLQESVPGTNEAERIQMQKLALSIVLTAQGIPFLHAGSEFLRTKYGIENSYQSPDSINELNWDRKAIYIDVVDYVKQLIALRKAHPAFRMDNANAVAKNCTFTILAPGILSYRLDGKAVGDEWPSIQIIFNGSDQTLEMAGATGWQSAVLSNSFVKHPGDVSGVMLKLLPHTCTILHR